MSTRNGLSTHILPTSATMIGICMTVLSINHLSPSSSVRWAVHKLLALDAITFLVSALFSFLPMKRENGPERYEALAELIFICGLGMLVVVALVLALAID